jgi:hypothetical protein
MELNKVKENIFMIMGIYMKVNGLMIKKMVKDNISMQIEMRSTKVNFIMDSNMVMGHIFSLMEICKNL